MENKAKFEHIVHREYESFRCFEIATDRYQHPYHYHPEIELTLIAESSGMRLVGDCLAPFAAGDLCLLGENLPHLYYNSQPTDTHTTARAIVLQFRRDCCGGIIDTAVELAPVAELLDRANRGLHFNDAASAILLERFQALLKAERYERISQFIGILGLLSTVAAQPLTSVGYRPTLLDHRSERINQACRYIFENSHQELSQADVARHIGLSTSAFSKFFQRATNQSYQQFLKEVRLGHASQLLLETDWSVAEISETAGFGNLSNFNRRFRQQYGVSPREFRQHAEQVRVTAGSPQFTATATGRKDALKRQLATIRSGG